MRKLWIAALVLAADQLTKLLVTDGMEMYESFPVLGNFFRITYIHNPGAVFGLQFGGPYLHLALALVAMAAVGSMLRRVGRDEHLVAVGLALVLGGAIGNVVDRLRFGEVIDFLDFGLGSVRWYVFNVADAAVTTGVGLLILAYGFLGKPNDAESPECTARERE